MLVIVGSNGASVGVGVGVCVTVCVELLFDGSWLEFGVGVVSG